MRGVCVVTDALGRVFISYRRSRSDEVTVLVQALHDVGIPTWQDVTHLGHEPVEDAVRALLRDPSTAGAILFLTREVRDSPFIRRVEVPEILRHHGLQDGFWLLPVLAGDLSRTEPPRALADTTGAAELAQWKPHLAGKSFSSASAAAVAAAALRERTVAVHARLDRNAPLRVRLDVQPNRGLPGDAFVLDWAAHFTPLPNPARWEATLLPALGTLRKALCDHAPGRAVEVTGTPSLPAAFALGYALREPPPPMKVVWLQRPRAGREQQTWSLLDAPDATLAKEAGWTARTSSEDVDGRDLAVLINVTNDAGTRYAATIAATRPTLPRMRAKIIVDHKDAITAPPDERPDRISIGSGAEAASLARLVRSAIRGALDTYGSLDAVHVFLAGPTGLAMLIGQLGKTLPPIVTYDAPGTGNTYTRAATLGAAKPPDPRKPRRRIVAAAIVLLATVIGIVAAIVVPSEPPPPAVLGECSQVGVFTGQEDSPYHRYGNVLKDRIEESYPGSSVMVQKTDGTSDNISRLEDPGRCDLAIIQLNVALDARAGVYDFEGEAFEDLRLVGPIWFDLIHLVVREDSGINDVGGLCGGATGKIASGLGNSGTRQIGEVLFRHVEQAPGCDLNGEQEPMKLADGLQGLRAGTVDAVLWAGGSPTKAINDAIADGLSIRLLPLREYLTGMNRQWNEYWTQRLENSDPTGNSDLAFFPGDIFEARQIDQGDYPGVVNPIPTVATPNGVAVNKKADPAMIRFVAEKLDADQALFEDALVADAPGPRKDFPPTPESVKSGVLYCTVLLHEKAGEYYRERGVRPPC
jgi:TRAP transporter TAXI family solute receptor